MAPADRPRLDAPGLRSVCSGLAPGTHHTSDRAEAYAALRALVKTVGRCILLILDNEYVANMLHRMVTNQVRPSVQDNGDIWDAIWIHLQVRETMVRIRHVHSHER